MKKLERPITADDWERVWREDNDALLDRWIKTRSDADAIILRDHTIIKARVIYGLDPDLNPRGEMG